MANLSGRYNNGTFEDLKATWDSSIQEEMFNEVIRSNDFSFEGDYSCRLKTKDLGPGQPFYGTGVMDIIPNSVTGQYYQYQIRIRVSNGIPDDLIFFLSTDQADGINNTTTAVKASEAKDGWVELNMIFKAKEVPFGGGCSIMLNICQNIENFLTLLPAIAESFPGLTNYSNDVTYVANEYIYIDGIDADTYQDFFAPEQVAGRRLYHVQNIFLLGNGIDVFEIDEPIGWDKILLTIDFDKDIYRYKYEFTDKDVVLQFDESAGRSILKSIWDELSVDGSASLKFGELNEDDELTVLYEGNLNFVSYKEDKNVVRLTAERQGSQVLFQSRINVPVNVDLLESLDGAELDQITKKELYLNSLLIKTKSEYRGNPNAVNIEEIPFTEEKPNPLDFVYTSVPLYQLIKNNSIGLEDPFVPDGRFLYTGVLPYSIAKRRIIVNARVKFSAELGNSGQQMYFGLILYKVRGVTNPAADIGIPFDAIELGGAGGTGGTDGESYSVEVLVGEVEVGETEVFTETLTLTNKGFVLGNDEAVMVKAYILATNLVEIPIEASLWLNPENWYLEVEEQTVQKPTSAQVYPIHELLNKQLGIITNRTTALKSDFFGRTDLGYAANGCGSNYGAISGEQLRGFNKPMNLSARSWVTSLSSLFCLGLSLERDNDNNEWFRVEPLPHFFRNIELIYLPIISNYNRESAEDFMFNEIEVGYSKFLNNNQPGSRKDFMNKKQYLTTFRNLKNKFIKLVDWILSSQYINLTLAQNIQDNPENAYETDKDIFLFHHNHTPVSSFVEDVQISFDAATKIIQIDSTDIPIKEGDQITILGTDGNNGVKTIVSLDMAVPYFTYIEVSEALVDETKPSTNIEFTERYTAKHNEDFNSIIGINPNGGIDNINEAKTHYNLRHHVKRIAQRWSKVFMTSDPSEVKFISGVNNDSIESTLNSDAECPHLDHRGDSTNVVETWTHIVKDASSDAFDKDSLGPNIWDKPLFAKNKFTFDAPMSWAVWNEVRKAFEARHPDGKDYGYISFLNPENVVEKGYLLNGKFDPVKQMCKLELIEKGTYYTT